MIVHCCCSKCAPILVDEYLNVTKVTPYATGATGPIDPYARPWYRFSDTGCYLSSSNGGPELGIECGIENKPVCYTHGFDNVGLSQPENITGIQTCAVGAETPTVHNNCYQKTGAKTPITRSGQRCGMGWKGVQAQAVWPGRFGFVNGGYCCNEPAQVTPQSKFTKINYSNEASLEEHTEGYYVSTGSYFVDRVYSHSFLQVASVDESGNVTRTGQKLSHSERTTTSTIDDFNNTDNCDGSFAFQAWALMSGPWDDAWFTITLFGATKDFPWACGEGTAPTLTDNPGNVSFAVNSGTATNEITAWTQSFSVEDNEILFTLICAATQTIRSDGSDTDRGPAGTINWFQEITASQTIRITLGTPYLYENVIAECKELLAEWDLTDDAQYPWRTDAKTWLQPLVTKDAAATEPSINFNVRQPTPPEAPEDPAQDCRFFDEIYYTGAIKGSPMPAGYDRFFNFTHINWERLAMPDSSCAACEMSLGMESPAEIPPSATQWTNNFDGSQAYGPGGHVAQWLDYNYSTNAIDLQPLSGVWMQKWAETAESWPRQNLARPCGHDRWLRDELDGRCLNYVDETTLATTADVSYADGDIVGLPAGIYTITDVTGANTFTIAKLYDLPASITYEGCAKMSHPSARAICGRIHPVSITQSSPGEITVVLPKAHWFRELDGVSPDQVDFIDVAGLGSGVAVTIVDDQTFKVAGTLGSYGGAGYVASSGITSTTWDKDTTCSERKYITREWKTNLRQASIDGAEPDGFLAQSIVQYNYSGINPYVLCISPNPSDTFPSGNTYSFENLAADLCFQNEWHMDFVQAIQDPYWQETRKDNGFNDCSAAPCFMDSAPCSGTGCYEYKPMIEPTLLMVGEGPMPRAVLATYCESEPNQLATVHNIRAAWEECSEWKTMLNTNCGVKGY